MALTVGIPKEIKPGERRVSLTPCGVRHLNEQGITTCVERGAGMGSGFTDRAYAEAGARLVHDGRGLWREASLIKKVKEPIPSEFGYFESKHIIFTYLHLASPSERPLIDALLRSRATAVAYETIEREGTTPLLRPMSEVAGVLAAYFAGLFQNYIAWEKDSIRGLESIYKKMEETARNYPDPPKDLQLGRIIVLGGGHVGEKAAQMAARMGGEVYVTEISESISAELAGRFQSEGIKVTVVNPDDRKRYQDMLSSSDVIVSAVHAAGKRAPLIIDSNTLGELSRGKKKIILDIAIDQGGNVAESKPVDYSHPLYVDSFGHLRFSVTNIPSLCGRGASEALEKVSLDYTAALAQGLDFALKRYPELASGVNVSKGMVTHPAVKEAYELQSAS